MTLAVTESALKNADVLRLIAERYAAAADTRTSPWPEPLADVAKLLGRGDAWTFKRTLKRMADDELVQFEEGGEIFHLCLTNKGRRALDALKVADGSITLDDVLAEPSNARPGAILCKRSEILFNPDNPRKAYADGEIEAFAESIAASHGNPFVPLMVMEPDANGYRILVAGERRLRAIDWLIAQGRRDPTLPIPCDVEPPSGEDDDTRTLRFALTENGGRKNLTMLEEARAYARLMALTGQSARALALEAGRDVRSVQEMVMVLERASPEDIAAHEAYEADPKAHEDNPFTWERLRKSVRESKPKPALETTPKLALLLAELALFAASAEQDENGYALAPRIPDNGDRGGEDQLITRGAMIMRQRDNRLAYGLTDTAQEWVRLNTEEVTLADLVAKLRRQVLGAGRLAELEERNRWATRWLNPFVAVPLRSGVGAFGGGAPTAPAAAVPPPAAPAATLADRIPGASNPPPAPHDATDKPPTPAEMLALVETAHRLRSDAATTIDGLPAAVVQEQWRSAHGQALAQGGHIEFINPAMGARCHVRMTAKGVRTLLAWLGLPAPISPHFRDVPAVGMGDLDRARKEAGAEPGFDYSAEPYLNHFLNAPAEAPAAAAQAEPDSAQEEEPDEEQAHAAEALVKAHALREQVVANQSYQAISKALRAAVNACDIVFPLAAGSGDTDCYLFDAKGRDMVVVDVNNELPTDLARAITLTAQAIANEGLKAILAMEHVEAHGLQQAGPAPMFALHAGQVVTISGGATYRLLSFARTDARGTPQFLAQQLRKGKDYGKPRTVSLLTIQAVHADVAEAA